MKRFILLIPMLNLMACESRDECFTPAPIVHENKKHAKPAPKTIVDDNLDVMQILEKLESNAWINPYQRRNDVQFVLTRAEHQETKQRLFDYLLKMVEGELLSNDDKYYYSVVIYDHGSAADKQKLTEILVKRFEHEPLDHNEREKLGKLLYKHGDDKVKALVNPSYETEEMPPQQIVDESVKWPETKSSDFIETDEKEPKKKQVATHIPLDRPVRKIEKKTIEPKGSPQKGNITIVKASKPSFSTNNSGYKED